MVYLFDTTETKFILTLSPYIIIIFTQKGHLWPSPLAI